MHHTYFRFGDFRLEPAARELWRGAERIALPAKSFDCLAYLIGNRERAVGRDELSAAIWGKADVSDAMLGQIVLKARRAIDDSGDDQHAIRTVPRFGYRWVAAVEECSGKLQSGIESAISDDVENGDAGLTENDSTHRPTDPAQIEIVAAKNKPQTISRSIFLLLFLLLVIVACSGTWWIFAMQKPTAPITKLEDAPESVMPATTASAPQLLLVFPVSQNNPSEQTSWIRLGLMDLIASRLRDRGSLPVVPNETVVMLARNSAAAENAGPVDLIELRQASGAQIVVLPEVLRQSEGWRVRLVVYQPTAAPQLLDGDSSDIIAAATIASDKLLALLGVAKPGDKNQRFGDAGVAEVFERAEAAMLAGQFSVAKKVLDDADARTRAIPEIQLKRAQIHFRAGELDQGEMIVRNLLEHVAGVEDPAFRGDAQAALGSVLYQRGAYADAEQMFTQAIVTLGLNGNALVVARAYLGQGIAHAALDQLDQAEESFAHARLYLEPSGDRLALGRLYLDQGELEIQRNRHDAAAHILRDAIADFESYGAINERLVAGILLVQTQFALLHVKEALRNSEALLALSKNTETPTMQRNAIVYYASALKRIGRLADAARALDQLEARSDTQADVQIGQQIATVRAELALDLREPAQAVRYAETALQLARAAPILSARVLAADLLLRVWAAQGKADGAAAVLTEMQAWSASDKVGALRLRSEIAGARMAAARDDIGAALEQFDAALQLAERVGSPADTVDVCAPFAEMLIAHGDIERAAGVVGRVARWADEDFDSARLQVALYRALGDESRTHAAMAHLRELAGERWIAVPDRNLH